ncbi:MAG: hypothetical protein M3280_09790 [Actinomycetota bacterium]|nr:hypothetical protein [Actinomycetota bacterium]
MKPATKWLAVGASAVVCAASTGGLLVAATSKSQAGDSLAQAIRLHRARLDVARAQRELGGSDLSDAVDAGRKANAIALRVGRHTRRIADLLEPLGTSARRAVALGRRGIRSAITARRQTKIAAEVLAVIAGYQRSATEYAATTNSALRRILRALRETNESVPER